METVKVCAVVIKSVQANDNDKFITILDSRLGKLNVSARGARSMKNRNSALCQMFCYSEMVLQRYGDNYYLDSGQMLEGFFPLRQDPQDMSYAAYFCEILLNTVSFGDDCTNIIRLLLNTFHCMSNNSITHQRLRLLFEMRLLAECGFAPNLSTCSKCGLRTDFSHFDSGAGGVVCTTCCGKNAMTISDTSIKLFKLLLEPDLKLAFAVAKQLEISPECQQICTAFFTAHFDLKLKTTAMLAIWE